MLALIELMKTVDLLDDEFKFARSLVDLYIQSVISCDERMKKYFTRIHRLTPDQSQLLDMILSTALSRRNGQAIWSVTNSEHSMLAEASP